MFWVIFGVYIIFEQHFEYLVRWVPGFYYLKASFILVVAFPQLQMTKFVFHKGIVPTIENCNRLFLQEGGVSTIPTLIVNLPLILLGLAFPFFHQDEDEIGQLLQPCVTNQEQESCEQMPEAAFIQQQHHQEEEEEQEEVQEKEKDEEEQEEGTGIKTLDDEPLAPSTPSPKASRRPWTSPSPSMRFPSQTPSPSRVLAPLRPASASSSPALSSSVVGSPKSPYSSLSGLSDRLQNRLKDSSRRLSNITAMLHKLSPTTSPSKRRAGSANKENIVKEEVASKPPPSPHPSHTLPEPSFVASVKSMFSLDLHSPPCNSVQRESRRQTLMALRPPAPGPEASLPRLPRTPPAAIPSFLSMSSPSTSESGKSGKRINPSSLAPIDRVEDAILSGSVSMGRRSSASHHRR